MIPELLKKSKVKGSLINHSEHRIDSKTKLKINFKIKRIKNDFSICVKDVAEAKKIFKIKSRLYCN